MGNCGCISREKPYDINDDMQELLEDFYGASKCSNDMVNKEAKEVLKVNHYRIKGDSKDEIAVSLAANMQVMNSQLRKKSKVVKNKENALLQSGMLAAFTKTQILKTRE